MVQFARNFVVDLANYTPASAETGYLSAARFMSPELLSRFELMAREQLKQVVTNRASQFFTVDSYKVEGKDPLVVRFLYAPRRDATKLDPTPLTCNILDGGARGAAVSPA